MKVGYVIILSTLAIVSMLLAACGGSENSYTLYKTTAPASGERLEVKSFAAEPELELNHRACFKEKIAMARSEKSGAQYWCEKG